MFNIFQLQQQCQIVHNHSFALPRRPLRGVGACSPHPSISIHRDLLPFSPTRDLSYHCPSLLISVFLFSFCQPLLFSKLSLSISPHSFSIRLLPISVCSPVPSSSGVSSFPYLLLIPLPSVFSFHFRYSPNPIILCYLQLLLSLCQCRCSQSNHVTQSLAQ